MYVFDRNKARQLQAKLAEQNLDSNLAKLLDFFKYDYGMITDLENKLGSKDFNLLRSHLLACKIDQNRYLAAIKGSSQFTELFELPLTKVRRFWEHQTYDNLLENII